ncbi:palmitoyltransferase ZDHHC6 isoform X2 [Anabrus simplex]|uniref:palmitoyltransferase ZDHHC6 isoform X2 n=1 Tax=Anabrus simplex TaxID=316456 RepID=UPI0035A38527
MCTGPLKKICHWGPLTALGIIKSVSFMTIHCSSMWWPPAESVGGFLNTAVFISFSALTLYNFLSAIYEGPGFLPFHWKPAVLEDAEFLQFCNTCDGYKAPRSHHCRKCGRCVLKMDHHCPWINNCVGHYNHAHFTAFLFWAVCGCLQASVVLTCSLYVALNRVWYLYYGDGRQHMVHLTVSTLAFCVFCLGLAIGVVLAVGMLLFFQVRAVVRNQTGIEDWIVEKARHRREGTNSKFIFPYNLGWKENFKQVINLSCTPVGDGVVWPVVEGCDQYTLTREQKEQKSEKRYRTRTYTALENYSGSWIPVTKGWRVLCHPPFTDECRISLRKGDTILVTRWRRYWLFGEKLQAQETSSSRRERGWFPRPCVVELIEGVPNYDLDDKTK